MNTHPWTLQKAGLTFSPLQGGGEAFRNQQAPSKDRRLVQVCCGSADSLPAGSRAESTNWPLTHLQKGQWEQQAPTPALRTVLTPPFSSQLHFRLTLTLGFLVQEQEMDKARSTAPVPAAVFKIFPMSMELGLGTEDALWFECAVKESSRREIYTSTLVFY